MIIIRKLTLKDVSAFIAFREIASKESKWVHALEEGRAEELILSSINVEAGGCYGAFDQNKQIAGAYFLVSKKEDSVNIGSLVVLKKYQGQGLASKFKEIAESLARENDISKLSLYVDINNKTGMAIYRKWGFQRGKETIVEMTMPVFLTPVKVAATENAIYGNW